MSVKISQTKKKALLKCLSLSSSILRQRLPCKCRTLIGLYASVDLVVHASTKGLMLISVVLLPNHHHVILDRLGIVPRNGHHGPWA